MHINKGQVWIYIRHTDIIDIYISRYTNRVCIETCWLLTYVCTIATPSFPKPNHFMSALSWEQDFVVINHWNTSLYWKCLGTHITIMMLTGSVIILILEFKNMQLLFYSRITSPASMTKGPFKNSFITQQKKQVIFKLLKQYPLFVL